MNGIRDILSQSGIAPDAHLGAAEVRPDPPAQQADNLCYQKAIERGERTFTLVEHDITGPQTILFWIFLNFHSASKEKLQKAWDDAMYWRTSPMAKRFPD